MPILGAKPRKEFKKKTIVLKKCIDICLVKKVLWEASQNSQENDFARVSFFKAPSAPGVLLWNFQNF